MDKTGGPDAAHHSASGQSPTSVQDRPKKRFGVLSALARFAIALLVVGFALYQVMGWVASRPEAPQRINRERTFTVNAVTPAYGTHGADITTFGQVVAARTLDLRAQVQGRVIEVSPRFVAGGEVEAGELLVRIDPFSYDAAVLEAQAAIANAELSLAEAREAKTLEERNITTARSSLAAAETDLERARSLLASGAATQQTVDTRALTVAERQQALNQREANLFTLDAQILRQQAAIAQAGHELDLAERNRANTEITAPFDATVTASAVTEGGYVNANENLGSLYETAALDVHFMLSDRQFRDLSATGIVGRALTVSSSARATPGQSRGTITRVAAEVDPSTGGIMVFARLDANGARQLRPGTFVSVAVEGVAHERSLLIPETAVYDEDHLYVIREGRMAAVRVDILARSNDQLIVRAEIAEGERIITSRLSQAGEGVAVEGEESTPAGGGTFMRGGPGGGG